VLQRYGADVRFPGIALSNDDVEDVRTLYQCQSITVEGKQYWYHPATPLGFVEKWALTRAGRDPSATHLIKPDSAPLLTAENRASLFSAAGIAGQTLTIA